MSRKLRSVERANSSSKAGYDGQRELCSGLMPDPDKHGMRRVMIMNTRESGIAQMIARGQLSGHQARAAQRFEAIHAGLNSSPNQAVDTARPVVDTSGRTSAIPESVMTAGLEMSHCVKRLGKIEYAVVTLVAGEGLTIRAAAYRMSGRTSKRAATVAGQTFKEALDNLAAMWGLAGGSQAGV